MEPFADPYERRNRHVSCAPFDRTVIGAMHANAVRECFLADAKCDAAIPKRRADGL